MKWLACIALIASSGVLIAAAEDEDDVDRTDFTEEHLKQDRKGSMVATEPHSDVEPVALLPDAPDGKVPVGVSNALLVALVNGGRYMFNVSGMDGVLETSAGVRAAKLPLFEWGEPLGPHKQASYRYPFTPDAKLSTGEYRLIANIYYANRDKDKFVSVAFNETIELVPQPFSSEQAAYFAQVGLAAVVGAVLVALVLSFAFRGASIAPAKKSKPASVETSTKGDDWLAGTSVKLQGASPASSPKKGKPKKKA